MMPSKTITVKIYRNGGMCFTIVASTLQSLDAQ
jgi:hypothetical protein